MANIVECRSQLRTDVDGISRLRQPEEVFARSDRVRPGVTGAELHVIGHSLGGAHQQPVVVRGAGVLVGAYCREARIRPGTKEEEARMRRIRQDRWRVSVTLAEQAETKLSNVLDLRRHRPAELMLDPEVEH